MRILYDGFIYQFQTAGGINRYFTNLISRLPESFSPMLLAGVPHVNYPTHENLKLYQLGKRRLQRVSYRLSERCGALEDSLQTRMLTRRAHVFHPTYYRCLLENRVKVPTVITVWDMIHEIFAEQMDPDHYHAREKREAIMAAQHVICISENTRKDLLERYPLSENRVSVTHLASEIDAGASYGPEPTPERPYYLYVGSRAVYKNFHGLLRAFAHAVEANNDLTLCVVGNKFNEPEQQMITDLKIEKHIEHFGQTTDAHLAKLYRCSVAFVYPSLYEGFGIPPLEAMSCGTVAIVSNVSSLPEVVGDAAILFDPHSEEELVAILRSLPGDTALRQDLIQRGARRARSFSWESTAAKTVQIYESLA